MACMLFVTIPQLHGWTIVTVLLQSWRLIFFYKVTRGGFIRTPPWLRAWLGASHLQGGGTVYLVRYGGCTKKNEDVCICVDLTTKQECNERNASTSKGWWHSCPDFWNSCLLKVRCQSWFWHAGSTCPCFKTPDNLHYPLRSLVQVQQIPFGIHSAPEVFQKRMSQILMGLGVVCMSDRQCVGFWPVQKQSMILADYMQHCRSPLELLWTSTSAPFISIASNF